MKEDNAKERLNELTEYVKRAPLHCGFIYVVREQRTRLVKIGYALDPIKRFQSIVSQVRGAMEALLRQIGNVEPEFELVTVVVASRDAEWFIHFLLKEARIAGEWYRESQIVDIVVNALEILRLNNYCLIVDTVEPG